MRPSGSTTPVTASVRKLADRVQCRILTQRGCPIVVCVSGSVITSAMWVSRLLALDPARHDCTDPRPPQTVVPSVRPPAPSEQHVQDTDRIPRGRRPCSHRARGSRRLAGRRPGPRGSDSLTRHGDLRQRRRRLRQGHHSSPAARAADRARPSEPGKAGRPEENPEGLRIIPRRPPTLRGQEVEPDAKGEYPVGTTALFVVAHGGGPMVVTVARRADGWKVDLRWWIAMTELAAGRPPAKDSPELAIRSLLVRDVAPRSRRGRALRTTRGRHGAAVRWRAAAA